MVDLYPSHREALTERAHRVLSVTGPPGVGKTTWVRACLPGALYVDARSVTEPEELTTRLWLALGSADNAVGLEESMRARGEATLILDHADDVLDAGAGSLLESWLAEVPAWRFVVLGRRAHPPWEQHLITLDAPERDALDALARDWLPGASSVWLTKLVDLCASNPGALFVLSRRARLMPLPELVTGFEPVMLGEFGFDLASTLATFGSGCERLFCAVSAFFGAFSLDEARLVAGDAFDFDAFQALSDAGWVVREPEGSWRVPALLRAQGAARAEFGGAHASALDSWSRGWSDSPRSERDVVQLASRLDDLIAAWRWARSSPAHGVYESLYEVLAWLTTAPATSTWTGTIPRERIVRTDELERRAKELVRQGRWSEAIGVLHQSLVMPGIEHDSERVKLWANLAKLYRRTGRHEESALAYQEASEAALGSRDWARAARYLWRAHEAWGQAVKPERASEAAQELEWLCAEQPSARAAVPSTLAVVAQVGLAAPVVEPKAGTFYVTASCDGFHDARGGFVSLKRKRVATRLLGALVDAHGRDEELAARELFESGWPGQHAIGDESAMNRLRVAVARLRGLGLGAFLVTTDGGYRLLPGLTIVRLE